MKAPDFDYMKAATLGEAVAALQEGGEDAQLLAGGQSLMASLNLRLSAPTLLVDINGLGALAGIADDDSGVRIGALTRHAAVASSATVREKLPLIARAMPHVAHPAIRNRGTFGGSLALGDPAAEMPACAVALGGEITLESAAGRRTVPAESYYTGLYDSVRRPGEILTEVRFRAPLPGERVGFCEFARRHGDFAVVGVAARGRVVEGVLSDLRLVVFGCESHPRLAVAAREAAEGTALDDAGIARIVDALAGDIDPMENLQGGTAYKRHLAAVLSRRALEQMRDSPK